MVLDISGVDVTSPGACAKSILDRASIGMREIREGLERLGCVRNGVLAGQGVRAALSHDPLASRVREALETVPNETIASILEWEGFKSLERPNGCFCIDFEEMHTTVSRSRAIDIAALSVLLGTFRRA